MNFGTTRELKMTVICKDCEHQYGSWRERCPACGTATPAPPKAFNAPIVRAKREREPRGDECTHCRERKATERCELCAEPVHKNCRGLHTQRCAAFQVERQAAIDKIMGPACVSNPAGA